MIETYQLSVLFENFEKKTTVWIKSANNKF